MEPWSLKTFALEPRAQSPEPGARSPEPGARSPEPGARSPEPGARRNLLLGAQTKMMILANWSPRTLIFLCWSPGFLHLLARSPRALHPFRNLIPHCWTMLHSTERGDQKNATCWMQRLDSGPCVGLDLVCQVL